MSWLNKLSSTVQSHVQQHNQGGYPQQQQQGGYGAPPPQQNYGAPPPQTPYGQQPPQAPYGAPPQQQGQWNQPPPGQYGAPPVNNSYGAPPPQHNQYGAPPHQQYGAPSQQQQYGAPPQQQYNAPPQQQQYGASPQQQYNVPPAQQYGAPPQQQYGAPPQQQFGAPQGQGGPRFLGASIPAPPPAHPVSQLPGYNPQFDAERIRKATKGFGTDENTIIDTLAPLDPFQIDVLSRNYEQTTGRSLQKTLEKELSSWLEYTLVLKALGPLGGDIYLLNRACKGAGTHEDILNEILLGRSNEEIFLLKEGYKRVYNKDLVKTVQGELSMKTERMFNMALSGQRDENPYVNQQQVQQDVEALYRAGQGKIGTDEIGVCGILLSRSDAHLQAIAQAFPQRHKKSLSQMVDSEFSGHMRDGLSYLVKTYENDGQGIARDVEYLEAAMAGMGTKDERLIYRLLRCHWNRPKFASIKSQYQTRYRTTLRKRVEGETTGKYEKALVAIIEQS